MRTAPPSTLFTCLQSTMPLPKTYIQRPSPPKPPAPPLLSSQLPKNFLLAGIHAHIKKNSVPDLGIILSTVKGGKGASAAACFTRNAFKAAPVLVSEEILKKNAGRARGVVVNSGCANAVTGKQGMDDAWSMVRETDKILKEITGTEREGEETLVMSTGVIGQSLPIQNIIMGIRSLSPTSDSSQLGSTIAHWDFASRAFLTTDTFPKLRARTFKMGGVEYRIAGMDKGAGMIHPDMAPPSHSYPSSPSAALHATLLGCILTDAPISPRSAQSALTYAVERSFNSISVDGDMSTNDTIILLANGAGAVTEGAEGMTGNEVVEVDEEMHPKEFEEFKATLTEFAIELAQLVVRDGEGATKFVTVTVKVRFSTSSTVSSADLN